MLLSDTHFTPVVGIDVHFTTMPPYNPFHPYIGMVIDPMDYIPFLGSNVHVNGIKRGNSDTQGIIIPLMHIPLFTPPWLMTPVIGHESMNFFASQTVFSDGMRLSPKGHMLMTCNDIGLPLSLTPGKVKAGKKMLPFAPTLFAPTSFSLPIPTGMPVMVGGPYAPDWGGMLMGLAASFGFSTLMKLGRKFTKKLLKKGKGPKSNKSSKRKCKGDPVDVVNGAVIYEGSDFEIAAPIPFMWQRCWYSDSDYTGWLGHGVHCLYDRAVELYPEEDAIGLRMEDGRLAAFPSLQIEESYYLRSEKTTLTRTRQGYTAYDHNSEQQTCFTFYDSGKNLYRLTRVENQDGLSIKLNLSNNRLHSITDVCGRVILVTTNACGFIEKLELQNPDGILDPLVSYAYDDHGNMTEITDALGQTTHIGYTGHLMTEKTDRNGHIFYWRYDNQNRCVRTWGKEGLLETTFSYFPDKGYNIITECGHAVTTYRYDSNLLITEETDPMGNTTRYDYTEFMELYRQTDPEGRITGYSHDTRGNRTAITYPDNTQEIFVYDAQDRLIIAVDPMGEKNTCLYQKEHPHRIKSVVEKDQTVTHFDYNTQGLIERIRKEDKQIELEYDENFNLQKWSENGHTVKEWRYDYRGRVTDEYTPGQMSSAFRYDALDRVCRIYEPDGNRIDLQYNAYEEVVEVKDKHRRVTFGYTPLGSLRLREENGAQVRFSYDKMEQLTAIHNQAGETYRFARNRSGEIVGEKGFDGIERHYIRNRAGEVTRINRPENRYTLYEHDALGRITRAGYHDGSWESYTYNKNGALIVADNPTAQIVMERDAKGRVIAEKQLLPQSAEGIGLTAAYNALGQRTRLQTTPGADINTQYTGRGNVAGVQALTTDTGQAWQANLKHNEAGLETERFATGGIHVKTSYDSAGLCTSRMVSIGKRATGHRAYTWDVGSRLLAMSSHLRANSVYFNYDNFSNLANAVYDTRERLFKTPDLVGNLYKTQEQTDRQYGKGGRLLKDPQYHCRYDEEGNLILKTPRNINETPTEEKSDNFLDRLLAGNGEKKRQQAFQNLQQWQPGDTAYAWYANGTLRSITTPEGKTTAFEYDALGRRTAKLAQNKIYRYFWDANVLLHEWSHALKDRPRLQVDDLGRTSYDRQEPAENVTTWVYDDTGFNPVAKLSDSKRYTIVNDHLGTPMQAYDDAGTLVWDCQLDIYGNVEQLKGDKCFIPFRFQGQYEDEETGLYYNFHRYYDPNAGIYISQDPIGLHVGIQLYGYVHDTNTWTDVLGLMPIKGGKTAGGMSRATSDWLTRYGPATMRDHHLIPQEMLGNKGFMQQLDKLTGGKGVDYLHRQISTITNGLHQTVHADGWNPDFKKWAAGTKNKFSLKDLQKQIKQMMKDYNIPKSSRNFAKKYGCH